MSDNNKPQYEEVSIAVLNYSVRNVGHGHLMIYEEIPGEIVPFNPFIEPTFCLSMFIPGYLPGESPAQINLWFLAEVSLEEAYAAWAVYVNSHVDSVDTETLLH